MSTSAPAPAAPQARRSPQRARSFLWPREHGAYGQLGLPLVTALLSGSPSVGTLMLVVAAVSAFLAHEPLLVLLGTRGTRAKRELGASARRWTLGLSSLALASGSLALTLGDDQLLLACLVPLGWLAVLAPFVWHGREKTTLGELVAAAALSAGGLPVAVSGGLALERAALVWAVWWIAFAVSTVSVRSVIAAGRGEPVDWGLWGVGPAALLAAAWLTHHSWVGLATAPMLLVSVWLVLRPPPPRDLRKVGWTLMASSLLTATLLVTLERTLH